MSGDIVCCRFSLLLFHATVYAPLIFCRFHTPRFDTTIICHCYATALSRRHASIGAISPHATLRYYYEMLGDDARLAPPSDCFSPRHAHLSPTPPLRLSRRISPCRTPQRQMITMPSHLATAMPYGIAQCDMRDGATYMPLPRQHHHY